MNTTAKLVAIAYFLIEKNHEHELIKLINIFHTGGMRDFDEICQRPSSKMDNMNGDEKKACADRNERRQNRHRAHQGRCDRCELRGHIVAACPDDETRRMKTSTVNGWKDDVDALTEACNDDKLPWRQLVAPRRTTRTPPQLLSKARHRHRDRG